MSYSRKEVVVFHYLYLLNCGNQTPKNIIYLLFNIQILKTELIIV